MQKEVIKISSQDNFQKRYPGILAEKEIQDFWENEKIYKFTPDKGPIYSVDTPPPTVSGKLHIGHIFSFAQAEMLVRFRRMQGYNVYFPIGFDDNGLATERLAENELGIKPTDFERHEFSQKCTELAIKYEDKFKDLLRSMGFSYDFDLLYTTISEEVCKVSQISFLELAKNSQAYLKESPVLWCTFCKTSVAQAELDSKEVDSKFYYVAFKVDNEILEVATTRPELLCGVVCIFVSPDDQRYKKFIGKKAKVPLYNFEVPIMTDSGVDKEKGTGVVMCATFGDSTDVQWYNEKRLPYKNVITAHGKINEDVEFIGSLFVKEARKKISSLLKEKGLILKVEDIVHSVSIHERCDREIEIINSKQWFIDVLSKKDELIKAADNVNWYPEPMKKRYISWVKNLKWDWCISRQRYSGVPFPVWYCKKCFKPHFASEEELPKDPVKSPFSGPCRNCGCGEFTPEKSVMDTWATSSLTPQVNLSKLRSICGHSDKNIKNIKDLESDKFFSEFIPMGMRTHAHDIIRTWSFYTIVKSLYHLKKAPWKDLMICGFVLAKKGKKISKSKSNANFDPVLLIQEYTADALRYWAAGSRLGNDTFFDVESMKDTRRFITKLWNCSKFVISHLEDFEFSGKPDKMRLVDCWIMDKINKTIVKVSEFLEAFEVGLARRVIDDFFWKDFCDNYIEVVKERLYQPDIHGEDGKKSAQYASYYCLINILKMYAIFTPHLTEYIHMKGRLERFTKSPSIHMLTWEKNLKKDIDFDESIILFGKELEDFVSKVRKYKSERNMSMKAPLDSAVIECSREFKSYFEESEKDLIACLQLKKITYEFK
ncbi:MAG: valine--tRNA ligase [Oscillospiraceae bacterium]|nr:valine--tRNA ligase [Oscillospiraceae bacterium]